MNETNPTLANRHAAEQLLDFVVGQFLKVADENQLNLVLDDSVHEKVAGLPESDLGQRVTVVKNGHLGHALFTIHATGFGYGIREIAVKSECAVQFGPISSPFDKRRIQLEIDAHEGPASSRQRFEAELGVLAKEIKNSEPAFKSAAVDVTRISLLAAGALVEAGEAENLTAGIDKLTRVALGIEPRLNSDRRDQILKITGLAPDTYHS